MGAQICNVICMSKEYHDEGIVTDNSVLCAGHGSCERHKSSAAHVEGRLIDGVAADRRLSQKVPIIPICKPHAIEGQRVWQGCTLLVECYTALGWG